MVLINIFFGFFIGIFLQFYDTDDKHAEEDTEAKTSNPVGLMGKILMKKEENQRIKAENRGGMSK